MSSVKNVLTPRRKKRSASTRGASVEACSGKRGSEKRAVPAGGGVVVEAEEEKLIDRRADLVGRGLHQPQAEIARRRLDAVEVARDGARGREHDGGRDVRELPARRVGGVAEADRAREAVDRRLLAGQEVPACGGVEPSVVPQHRGLPAARDRG